MLGIWFKKHHAIIKDMHFEGHKLVSDQVEPAELAVIMRELRKVLNAGVAGDVVEFGCYVGTTSLPIQRELVQRPDVHKKLWVYDSFEGLPKKLPPDSSPAGMQFKAGELRASKQMIINNFKKAGMPTPRIKKAWFSDLYTADIPGKIAFAFLDGDYYQSIMDSLKLIWQNLTPGAVVVVDDYANEALPGVAKAVDAWLKKYPAKLKIEQSLAIISV